jgi:hypothetical protein
MLFQRYRAEATIEEEESLVWIHPTRDYVLVDFDDCWQYLPKKRRYIQIVW